ncbi:tegument host shutoff protein [Cercopithecine alphaherpesvirus 9]|nr:tegument host shutoff protein [Cercopithecine alphaherpesvirus 9]
MGLFGLTRFIHDHRLIKPSNISTPPGVLTPIAVDIWNVMYTLLERLYPSKRYKKIHGPSVTIHCLGVLLRLLTHRSYYPIFVLEETEDASKPLARGAKALVHETKLEKRLKSANLYTTISTGKHPRGFYKDIPKYYETMFPIIHTTEGIFEPAHRLNTSSSENHCMSSDKVKCFQNSDVNNVEYYCMESGHRLHHKLCASLIKLMGYAYVEANNIEADEACANLFHTRTAALVYTTDTDLLLMGCDIVLDTVPLFAPIVKCKDLLQYLGITYPEFLAAFVRCQTDLHTSETLRSVQQVIEDTGLKLPNNSIIADSHFESWRHKNTTHDTDLQPGDLKYIENVPDYTSNLSRVTEEAECALNLMPPSTSVSDELERAFVQHVITIVTPTTRGRLKLMKRVTVMQQQPSHTLIAYVLNTYFNNPKIIQQYISTFKRLLAPPLPLNVVLSKYWNG